VREVPCNTNSPAANMLQRRCCGVLPHIVKGMPAFQKAGPPFKMQAGTHFNMLWCRAVDVYHCVRGRVHEIPCNTTSPATNPTPPPP
jgi:hypothetical protein